MHLRLLVHLPLFTTGSARAHLHTRLFAAPAALPRTLPGCCRLTTRTLRPLLPVYTLLRTALVLLCRFTFYCLPYNTCGLRCVVTIWFGSRVRTFAFFACHRLGSAQVTPHAAPHTPLPVRLPPTLRFCLCPLILGYLAFLWFVRLFACRWVAVRFTVVRNTWHARTRLRFCALRCRYGYCVARLPHAPRLFAYHLQCLLPYLPPAVDTAAPRTAVCLRFVLVYLLVCYCTLRAAYARLLRARWHWYAFGYMPRIPRCRITPYGYGLRAPRRTTAAVAALVAHCHLPHGCTRCAVRYHRRAYATRLRCRCAFRCLHTAFAATHAPRGAAACVTLIPRFRLHGSLVLPRFILPVAYHLRLPWFAFRLRTRFVYVLVTPWFMHAVAALRFLPYLPFARLRCRLVAILHTLLDYLMRFWFHGCVTYVYVRAFYRTFNVPFTATHIRALRLHGYHTAAAIPLLPHLCCYTRTRLCGSAALPVGLRFFAPVACRLHTGLPGWVGSLRFHTVTRAPFMRATHGCAPFGCLHTRAAAATPTHHILHLPVAVLVLLPLPGSTRTTRTRTVGLRRCYTTCTTCHTAVPGSLLRIAIPPHCRTGSAMPVFRFWFATRTRAWVHHTYLPRLRSCRCTTHRVTGYRFARLHTSRFCLHACRGCTRSAPTFIPLVRAHVPLRVRAYRLVVVRSPRFGSRRGCCVAFATGYTRTRSARTHRVLHCMPPFAAIPHHRTTRTLQLPPTFFRTLVWLRIAWFAVRARAVFHRALLPPLPLRTPRTRSPAVVHRHHTLPRCLPFARRRRAWFCLVAVACCRSGLRCTFRGSPHTLPRLLLPLRSSRCWFCDRLLRHRTAPAVLRLLVPAGLRFVLQFTVAGWLPLPHTVHRTHGYTVTLFYTVTVGYAFAVYRYAVATGLLTAFTAPLRTHGLDTLAIFWLPVVTRIVYAPHGYLYYTATGSTPLLPLPRFLLPPLWFTFVRALPFSFPVGCYCGLPRVL